MRGIGGTNMENRGIDYRERSPLVVPPKPRSAAPAGASADVKAPNCEGSDEARRQGCDRRPQKREQGSARSQPHP